MVATGCMQGPAVRVEVCGDVLVPSEVDSLRISLADAKGVESYSGVYVLASAEDGGACAPVPDALPQTFELRDGAGEMWLTVQGLRDEVEVTRVQARVEFPVRGTTDVTVALTADCLGMSCPFGQTCVQGQCEVAQFGGTPDVCDALSPRSPADGTGACNGDGGP